MPIQLDIIIGRPKVITIPTPARKATRTYTNDIKMTRLVTCPNCKSKRVKTVIYGYLRIPFWKLLFPRDWIGGGCVIKPDSPAWHCAKCKHNWGITNRS